MSGTLVPTITFNQVKMKSNLGSQWAATMPLTAVKALAAAAAKGAGKERTAIEFIIKSELGGTTPPTLSWSSSSGVAIVMITGGYTRATQATRSAILLRIIAQVRATALAGTAKVQAGVAVAQKGKARQAHKAKDSTAARAAARVASSLAVGAAAQARAASAAAAVQSGIAKTTMAAAAANTANTHANAATKTAAEAVAEVGAYKIITDWIDLAKKTGAKHDIAVKAIKKILTGTTAQTYISKLGKRPVAATPTPPAPTTSPTPPPAAVKKTVVLKFTIAANKNVIVAIKSAPTAITAIIKKTITDADVSYKTDEITIKSFKTIDRAKLKAAIILAIKSYVAAQNKAKAQQIVTQYNSIGSGATIAQYDAAVTAIKKILTGATAQTYITNLGKKPVAAPTTPPPAATALAQNKAKAQQIVTQYNSIGGGTSASATIAQYDAAVTAIKKILTGATAQTYIKKLGNRPVAAPAPITAAQKAAAATAAAATAAAQNKAKAQQIVTQYNSIGGGTSASATIAQYEAAVTAIKKILTGAVAQTYIKKLGKKPVAAPAPVTAAQKAAAATAVTLTIVNMYIADQNKNLIKYNTAVSSIKTKLKSYSNNIIVSIIATLGNPPAAAATAAATPATVGKSTTEIDLSAYVLKSAIPPCASGGPVESPFATDEFYSSFEKCYQSYRPVGVGNRKEFLQCLGFNDAYKATKPQVPMVNSTTQKQKKEVNNVFEDMGDFVKGNLVYIVIGASVVISAMLVADKFKGKSVSVPVEGS